MSPTEKEFKSKLAELCKEFNAEIYIGEDKNENPTIDIQCGEIRSGQPFNIVMQEQICFSLCGHNEIFNYDNW